MSLLKKIERDFLLFDGAMGTMLQKSGLKPGQLPEQLNITNPELITNIHKLYLDAGSNIISTNTFGASELKLKKYKLSQEEIIEAALNNAKTAINSHSEEAYIAFDAGSLGVLLEPMGTFTFEEVYKQFRTQAELAQKYGADIILIETMSDIAEMRAALLAFKENCQLPVICSMTFDENLRTLTGTDPETMVHILQGLGADALGVNCSLGPKELFSIVQIISQTSRIPIIVQPNAGLPVFLDGKTTYNCSIDEYVFYTGKLVDLGATLLGGCCGTDPSYIKSLKSMLMNKRVNRTIPPIRPTVCSQSKTVVIDKEILIIGERINPTGNKQFKTALMAGDVDRAIHEAIEQKKNGAHILDVNVSLPGIDEVSTMKNLVLELSYLVNLPLQIDSTNIEAIEAALRIYPGKAIINSLNGKTESLEAILPLVKKYGALVVCLCMDENGIPKTAADRVAVAEKIINRAADFEIDESNLLIDCLVLTASAQQNEVLETLKSIQILKNSFRVKTILGVSNVSYGLPNRPLLNSIFLAQSIYAGLDAAIIDPTSPIYMDTIRACRVLNAMDQNADAYVQYFRPKDNSTLERTLNVSDVSMVSLIRDGKNKDFDEYVKSLLKETTALDVIENHIVPALEIIGSMYEKGEIFLPQLIRAAETCSDGLENIRKVLGEKSISQLNKGTIALATVKGDVHDIGKNLVKVVLESYGYTVIDLGKDVSAERVAEVVLKNDIKLVGLSALMTTTLPAMENTIKQIRLVSPECKIMVGGAVLNEKYAKLIQADFYCENALSGVKVANMIFS